MDGDPEAAYAEAQRRIAAWRSGAPLDLSIRGLDRIPPEIRDCVGLEVLQIRGKPLSILESNIEWRLPLSDLEPLAALTALTRLDCSTTEVSDLTPLAKLTSLSCLYCFDTPISDLTPLAGLTSLTRLDCSETWVSDLTPLQGLAALTGFACSRTDVSNLAPLANHADLSIVDCSDTPVSDLTPLADLTALTALFCSKTEIADLKPLVRLTALTRLVCYLTSVSDLTPLAGLTALTGLYCANTQVSDLSPLSEIKTLITLICPQTQVSDLSPLAGLDALIELNCSRTQVSDLTPLAGLKALTSLICSDTQVSDLSPLQGLTTLIALFCDHTPVSDLAPLADLTSLAAIFCDHTQISDLSPLSGLTALTHLYCSDTQVSDLTPLADLFALTHLHCSWTQVADLGPLHSLKALISLDCSNTQVADLGVLENLKNLESVTAYNLVITKPPAPEFWFQKSLNWVSLSGAQIPDTPAEALANRGDCLPALRAHLQDLGEEPERLNEARLLILGNGRVGKTQIRRRLCGEGFDAGVPSTHGIVVTSLPVPDRPEGRFHLWDFGGQDLYHGTHALFIRHRAAAMIVWEPNSEESAEHEHGGQRFRNHPLPYWLKQVEAFAGAETPLLIVQSQCDKSQDRRALSHEVQEASSLFAAPPYVLNYSAMNGRGLPALNEALREAFDAIEKPLIGRGRAAVKREIEGRIAEDAARPPHERRHRLMAREAFETLCADEGGISDPALFLEFLDEAGVVIARKGLFGGRILLDQNWALEAIYALFEREKVYLDLKEARGRFTRRKLGRLLWDEQGHSSEDQKLFMDMMKACGLCFAHADWGDDTVYLAPDLLPEEIPERVLEIWSEREADHELVTTYPVPPDFLIRGLICEVGGDAEAQAEYWRSGLHLYDETRKSRARADLVQPEGGWLASQIRLQAEGPQAGDLLVWLLEKLQAVEGRHGLKGKREERRIPPARGEERQAAPQASRDPGFRPRIFVSYAWKERDGTGPDREARVDEFCELARAKGYEVIRDKEVMRYGDSISAFMERLVEADRVAVFLSETYLQSEFCMAELHGIWTHAGQTPEQFRKRARIWLLKEDPPAIKSIEDRLEYAIHWKIKFNSLHSKVREHPELLSKRSHQGYKAMSRFASETDEILSFAADRVKPTTLEELLHAEDTEEFLREEKKGWS